MLSLCGVECDKCDEFGKKCPGCEAMGGKIFWAELVGLKICPIYDCCTNEKAYEDCGHCGELPCRIYFDTKDPSLTTQEHETWIKERVKHLKR